MFVFPLVMSLLFSLFISFLFRFFKSNLVACYLCDGDEFGNVLTVTDVTRAHCKGFHGQLTSVIEKIRYQSIVSRYQLMPPSLSHQSLNRRRVAIFETGQTKKKKKQFEKLINSL